MLAARSLFRRCFSSRVSWLATVIFALAPCHALPLAWLANREALVSLTFGALGLATYVQWRETRAPFDGALAAAFFGPALLGGVRASFGGFVLAFEIVRRREGILRRGVGLLAFAVPAASYLFARTVRHFGAVGSGFYSDPFREPASFLRTAPRRLATLLADSWLSLDTETLTSSTPAWALALGVVAFVALSSSRCAAPSPSSTKHRDAPRCGCSSDRSWRSGRCSRSCPRRVSSAPASSARRPSWP